MRVFLYLNRHIFIFACSPKRFYSRLNDDATITAALNLAETSKSYVLGSSIHGRIVKLGLSSDVFFQNNSIKMYTNCGVFGDARKVFDEMPLRNLVSWTLIISGANKNGEYGVALESFIRMIRTGCFLPNEFALGSIMKASISMGAIEFSLCIHCFSVKIGMGKNEFVGSSILHMYSKYGCIEAAERLFQSLNGCDPGCWNAMVGGYVQCGYGLEAISTLSSMHSKGILMDEFTFIHALTASSITFDLDFGTQIHGLIIRNGFEETVTLMNSLIDVYFKTGAKDSSLKLFKLMEDKDVASWNTILAAASQDASVEQVVSLFTDFMVSGLNPNRITFLILFRYCGDVLEGDLGLQFYGVALRLGLQSKPHVSNCLISMFSRCNAKESARSIFDSLSSRNIQNWNEMIRGYNWSNDPEALKLFTKLWGSSIELEPDEHTFSSAVEACFKTENVQVAQQVHGIVIKSGFASNGYICNSLIQGYVKFGFLTDSYAFFHDQMDIVSWGGLISTLVDQGYTTAAVNCLRRLNGKNGDEFIFGSVLNACASIATLNLTKSVHGQAFRVGLDQNEHVASAIIDAYGKSGDIESASVAFHRSCSDVAVFNTMIMAYANHGLVNEAMEVYERMKSMNLKPSQSTFVSILSACSHAGDVDLGRRLFRSMRLDYGMDPNPDNYGCLVDLLSRNGHLEEAKGVIEGMPFPAWPVIWRSFVSGCRIHGEKELGKKGARKLLEMKNAGYVLMSKIYCEDGEWENGLKVRKEMIDKGIKKDLGCSWINV